MINRRPIAFIVALLLRAPALYAQDAHPKPEPAKPVPPQELEVSIRRGVEFLLAHQNNDGSFGDAGRTKDLNIMASPPGSLMAFQTGTTALCITALHEAGGAATEVRQARDKAEAWLEAQLPKLRRATPMELYNVWAHAYGIQALCRMHAAAGDDAPRREKLAELIRGQFERLAMYESVDGGWGYYDFRVGSARPASDSTSFVNAAALVALHDAKLAGVEPPAGLTNRALAATRRQRKPDFSYLYGESLKNSPMMPINRPGGSLGRSQACNVALRLWGDSAVTDAVVSEWLDRLFARNGFLGNGRKRPIPHEAPFQVAGYFYYFGHYYAALCVDQLPAGQRDPYRDLLARTIIPLQEDDGSWWDYPLYNYHQPYGTAFALQTLIRCRKPQ